MNLTNRNMLLVIILISSVILLPALMGESIIALPEEDDLTADDDFMLISNFSLAWSRIPVHQMSVLLRLGISIFALFVVYLGGRSKHRRFNDRTINPVNVLMAAFLKTALLRAVFNFLVSLHLFLISFYWIGNFHPILILNRRSRKL